MAEEFATRPLASATVIDLKSKLRPENPRRHVLNRMMQEKSGRLYCGDEVDVEIPSFNIYAAR